MTIPIQEFWKLTENATQVYSDPTRQYFLLYLPGEGWSLYHRGIDAAFLLVKGKEALRWAPEFRIPLPTP